MWKIFYFLINWSTKVIRAENYEYLNFAKLCIEYGDSFSVTVYDLIMQLQCSASVTLSVSRSRVSGMMLMVTTSWHQFFR